MGGSATYVPPIKIKWIRGRGRINLDEPRTHLIAGQKGSGKSNLIESLGLRFLVRDGKVVDLFGSRDNEGLAWCRVVPRDLVRFVVGDSVEIKGRKWNFVNVKDLSLRHFRDDMVVVSVSAFYGDIEEEFHGLDQIVQKTLYRRDHWSVPWFLIVREASNFIYARIKSGKNIDTAKADFIYLLRESRHMGYSVGVDTIRWTSIDKEIRDVSDYTFIKRVGTQGLPRDLRFVYKYIEPFSFMNPRPSDFAVVSNRGPIGIGKAGFVPWHKREKEDILKEVGLRGRIKYGEVPHYGSETRGTVGDFEHGEIITKRFEGLSMHKIAEQVHRSSNTVMNHIHDHNEGVKERGYCLACRRIKHALAERGV